VERGLPYVLAWRIHSFCVGRVLWTITQDTPPWPSSTTFEYNSRARRHNEVKHVLPRRCGTF
jgi:hypothetical protein